MNSARQFVRELSRRRVPQVTAIYLAGGWIAIEVSDTTFPRLGLPDWTVTFVLVLVLLGLPVALALAWFYDVAGGRVVRTPDAAAAEPSASDARSAEPRPAEGRATRTARTGIEGRIAVVGAVAVLSLAGLSFVLLGDRRVPLEEGTVAVLPFRAPAQLEHLREGMVDLLATKLSAEAGPRAAEPRVVLRAWRSLTGGDIDLLPEDAARVAARVGASHALMGEVVAAGGSVTLSASLLDTRSPRGRGRRASVTGPADSVLHLVDRLAIELLSIQAGESEQRLETLTSTSLDAVVEYLAGQQSYRAGRFDSASERFGRALDFDSTFGLAALYQERVLGWGVQGDVARAERLAWRYRDRLGTGDRARVLARYGPGGPDRPTPASEWAEAIQASVHLSPDDPEAWEQLGDLPVHAGHEIPNAEPARQARSALERAFELDTTFTAPLVHLVELAARDRDTAAVRRYYQRYAAESGMETAAVAAPGYIAALALGDGALAERFGDRLASGTSSRLNWVQEAAILAALPLDGLRGIRTRREAAAPSPAQRRAEVGALASLEMAGGRVTAARETLDRLETLGEPWPYDAYWFAVVLDGDSTYARARLERAIADPAANAGAFAGSDVETESLRSHLRCLLARYRIEQGDTAGAAELAREAMSQADEPSPLPAANALCGFGIRAMLDVLDRSADAAPAIARVDSFALSRPELDKFDQLDAILLAARLWEEIGQPGRALATVRRLELSGHVVPASLPLQARLAARLGYREEAVQAYRLFLDLRRDAEPGTRAWENLERAKRDLANLATVDG